MKSAIACAVFAACNLLAGTAFGFSYPSFGVARWTAYMMGVDTADALASVKAAVAGKAVTVAIAYSTTSTVPGQYEHDDYMESEMTQTAQYLGLTLNVVRIPPEDLGVTYQKAVAAGDIVVDYRSYWGASVIAKAAAVIAANPDKLFILPYGEISPCPATSTSLQGLARHADGTGFANLVNTIPLAYSFGGAVMRPLRRTAEDTSTVSFVVPTAWSSSIGETCPSAAAASVAAACLYAAHGGRPSAGELVRLLSEGAGFPQVMAETEFDEKSLAQLKSDLAEMTVTDSLGRKMLLYDRVVNLKGSLDLLAAERAGIYAQDSFESFAPGTDAGQIDGWSGDGFVEAAAYQPPVPPGYPMPEATHSKVLDADDVVRALPDPDEDGIKVDTMFCMSRPLGELAVLADDVKVGMSCDQSGRLCLWHAYEEGGAWRRGWIPLSEKAYADGEWVRVGFEFASAGGANGDKLVKVTVNGSCQPTAHGVRSPTEPLAYGPWHYLATKERAGGVALPTELGFTGTKVDDLLFCETSFEPKHTGEESVADIPFGWFDAAGFPRDPTFASPFVKGYTLGDVYDAGLDPYSERPLELTDVSLEDGWLRLVFNGYRGDEPINYRLLRSEASDFGKWTEVELKDGTFEGDAATWTTTWSCRIPDFSDSGFYRLKAMR